VNAIVGMVKNQAVKHKFGLTCFNSFGKGVNYLLIV